ncbi:1-acyl-sn-glycerol-3-phosphate acyltransferase [Flammeovirga yaeyamensis]|uniref:1-acyl-sn-glycerol-3-phosphate acyltransferase n=1 Tax=Flammeovirga yaeyamensis TaxID=367791 RepID=A0AAX1NE94_9BACT|nr:lysophospholipid acyltransferase family protein [Flammeovirga yaeyamensis]MBB3699485.1 1-acyl-sn-glycerol-3-phosphate acyltransferase [Flammeovirga yaeyamensis]NMF35258.1 1-acyl-sn-glycerol-3-phosphate acyltransferase [Flammeovirga yaeyamensis]QWG04118.1 1-acyl-sn-glycerol-3-phosphate acyltransferase [Flammeovirga yaeyamensis]
MKFLRATYRLFRISTCTIYYIIWGKLHSARSEDPAKVTKKMLRNWAKKCLYILNYEVKVINQGKLQPRGIIMSNHRSYVDIFILFSLYPSSIVAKSAVGKWPGLRSAVKLADMILVDRGNHNSRLNTMKEIKARVENEKRVVLFPEGGIGDSYYPQKFKGGSFLIASQLNAPITPITLWYEDQNDAWMGSISFVRHFYQQMGKKKSFATIKVQPPVQNDDHKALSNEVYDVIYQSVSDFDHLQKDNKQIA